MEEDTNENFNPDVDLHVTESVIVDLTPRIANTERLVYIYTLTGIILATVIVTLIRSFIFFSVCFSFSAQFETIYAFFPGIIQLNFSFVHSLQ